MVRAQVALVAVQETLFDPGVGGLHRDERLEVTDAFHGARRRGLAVVVAEVRDAVCERMSRDAGCQVVGENAHVGVVGGSREHAVGAMAFSPRASSSDEEHPLECLSMLSTHMRVPLIMMNGRRRSEF